MNDKSLGRIAVLLGIVIVLIIAFGSHQSCQTTKSDFQLSEAQRKLSDSLYKKELKCHIKDREKWAEDAKKEKAIQAGLNKQIEQLRKDKGEIASQLVAEKKKTKTLAPDQLVFNLSSRIGRQEVRLTAGLTYDFTRLGAEGAWNIFLDEQGWLGQLRKEEETSKTLEGKVTSLTNEKGAVEKQRDSLQIDLTNCDKAKTDAEKSKDEAVKEKKGQRWKGRKEGAVFSVIVLGILKLAGWMK